MGLIQFLAVILMLLLTLTLLLPMPRKVVEGKSIRRTRYILALGTSLVGIQFLLQYVWRPRDFGVTPAILLNLIFFIPAAYLFNIAILNMERQGRIKRHEWLVGIDTWIITIVTALGVSFIFDVPLLGDSEEMHWVLIFCSLLFATMQVFYFYTQYKDIRRIRRSLNDFYDYEADDMLLWMEVAVMLMAGVALPMPAIIFGPTWLIGTYSVVFFACIYYLIFSFACFVVSSDAHRIFFAENNGDEESEDNDEKAEQEVVMSPADYRRVEHAVARWIDEGGHLQSGITIQTAASDMKLPRYQLSAWLKTTEQELFSPWLTYLRVEEAKKQMKLHPEWSNDIIAEHCGFASRSYFQTVFRKNTGMTPMQFVEEYVAKDPLK